MTTHSIKTVTLALTGASGMPYGFTLLQQLLQAGIRVWLLYSTAAQIVAKQETDWELPTSPEQCKTYLCNRLQANPEQLYVFGKDEWFAPPASGTNPPDAMIVCPASMGVIAAIAHGTSDHLIERAADVCLKERRPLILVPREAPLSTLHLENLLKLSQMGVTVLPPAPGFYHQPQTIDDMINFVVARILDQLRIPHTLMQKWGNHTLPETKKG